MGSKSPDFLHAKGPAKGGDATPGHDDRPVGWARSNRGIALVLIVITLVIGGSIWSSEWAHREVRDGFKLGSFPMFAIILMFLSLLVMAFDSKSKSTTEAVRDFKLVEGGIVLALLLALGGAFLLIPVLGFAVVIFLIVFLGALLLGYRPVWIALVTALVTAGGLHALTIVLNVQFPPGLLGFIGG